MRPKERRDCGQKDLFCARFDLDTAQTRAMVCAAIEARYTLPE